MMGNWKNAQAHYLGRMQETPIKEKDVKRFRENYEKRWEALRPIIIAGKNQELVEFADIGPIEEGLFVKSRTDPEGIKPILTEKQLRRQRGRISKLTQPSEEEKMSSFREMFQ
jgi:hypothetical protein